MATLDLLVQQFFRERTYLKNVSPKTCVWYESAWKGPVLPSRLHLDNEWQGQTRLHQRDRILR